MTDLPMHRRSDADLEAALRDLGANLAWPSATAAADAPDIASIVRSRIEAAAVLPPARRGWTWRPARRALVLGLIAVLALAAVASAIGFGLPGLRLLFGGPSLRPPPTLAPTAAASSSGSSSTAAPSASSALRSPSPSVPPGPPGASMSLGDPVAIADLDAAAGFHVRWPQDPAFGPPDAASIDATRAGQVSLVWAARPGLPASTEPGVGLLLSVFDGTVSDGFFTKVINEQTTVELVNVGDHRGYWISGDPHMFFYERRDGAFVDDHRRWVADALLWADGDLTYRLESPLGKAATIRLAESMR
jgi:hypothetical protein